MSIRIDHISKDFGRTNVLRDISLDVATGELVALPGPSGSGKTTLLRIIAGLEFPNEGQGSIAFHGAEVTFQSAYARKAGFVFQHYALFNHMSVADDIAFGLKVMPRRQRPPRPRRKEIVQELLERIQLPELGRRFPAQLSGGQRQRVALARALAVNPQVLLLDEPFGALDAKVRKELRHWQREFHDKTRLTTLFVTHDQDEAFELADRVESSMSRNRSLPSVIRGGLIFAAKGRRGNHPAAQGVRLSHHFPPVPTMFMRKLG